MNPDIRFLVWKKAVDYCLSSRHGLIADDLPDAPYRDWYEANVLPSVAAKRAIRLAQE